MKLTVNKTNVLPASADYPFGGQKDDDGTFNGTPLDAEFSGDYVQFFEKLFDESGIVSNGLPDNATNGFQLFDALLSLSPHLKYSGFNRYRFNSSIPYEVISGSFVVLNSSSLTIEYDLSTGSPSENIVSFGDEMPKGTIINLIVKNGTGLPTITLNSTNAGSFPIITKEGVSGNNTNYTITFEKIFRVIRLDDEWRLTEL